MYYNSSNPLETAGNGCKERGAGREREREQKDGTQQVGEREHTRPLKGAERARYID